MTEPPWFPVAPKMTRSFLSEVEDIVLVVEMLWLWLLLLLIMVGVLICCCLASLVESCCFCAEYESRYERGVHSYIPSMLQLLPCSPPTASCLINHGFLELCSAC